MGNAFLDQGEGLTFREIVDLTALKELARHIRSVYGFGLALVSSEGEILTDTASEIAGFEALLQGSAGQASWKKFLNGLIVPGMKRGQMTDREFEGGAMFRILTVTKEFDVIGVAALGPYCRPGPALAWPKFSPDEIDRIGRFLSNILDVLVFSNWKRHLTNLAHLEAISESYRDLEKANEELQASFEKLKEMDQMKSNFLAVVSHELRTPLTSVIGYSEMLLEGLAGDLNESQKNYVRVIMEKGDQLLNLIREILNLSKIEAGKMKVSVGMLDPREVVTLACETIRPVAEKKSIKVDCHIAKDLEPSYQLDREKLLQIYNNLLSNAVKFTEEGGSIRLSVERSKRAGPAPQDPAGSFLLSVVEDSGIGIPAEHLEKIFSKFFQVDNSSTRAYGGTGLGLTITKSFVEMHGGRIWVESEIDKGTRVSFTISTEIQPTKDESEATID